MKSKLLILLFVYFSVFAQEYAVVSNKFLKKLSKKQIKAIFLKKLTYIDGVHLVPVNLSPSSPIREKFEKNILNMSKKRLKAYWVKKHYLGKRPPVTMKSQESAIKFIQNVSASLTYVKASKIAPSTNVLYRWEE
jgi:ABC-type phosphate transport system substrate-binding protein